jgi:hypothetical protein
MNKVEMASDREFRSCTVTIIMIIIMMIIWPHVKLTITPINKESYLPISVCGYHRFRSRSVKTLKWEVASHCSWQIAAQHALLRNGRSKTGKAYGSTFHSIKQHYCHLLQRYCGSGPPSGSQLRENILDLPPSSRSSSQQTRTSLYDPLRNVVRHFPNHCIISHLCGILQCFFDSLIQPPKQWIPRFKTAGVWN